MIVNISYQTVSCDGPNCKKTATYEASPQGYAKSLEENPWLFTARGVTAAGPDEKGQPRQFSYCSDACEVNAITAGTHNALQKKVIDIAVGSTALKQAAEQAARQQAADKAIREGVIT
jgi:hypothetical protein